MDHEIHGNFRFQQPTTFTTTKYLVNDEFAEMLGLIEPVTRQEVTEAFINYSINADFVGKHYNQVMLIVSHRLKRASLPCIQKC
jgi:hypothetical protein